MLERIKKWIMSAFANTAEVKEFKEMVIEEELPVEVVEESTEKNEPIEDAVVPKKPKRKYNKKKKANGNESK